MHVLVMTESWQAALACIQSFGRRGHRVSVLHSSFLSPHAYSRFVYKRIPFDNKSDTREERASKLLQLLQAGSVDVVIPICDEDAHLLAVCKTKEPKRHGLISPPLASIEIVRSRAKTEKFCQDNGIRIPESVQIASMGELRAAASELGFPVVIKESNSTASQGVRIVNGEQDFAGLKKLFSSGQALQVQKFIQGDFVGVTGFGWQGQLKGRFSFRVAYEHSHGGTPPYAISEKDGASTDMLAHIVKCLNWSGGIDIDLLRDASGELYLLEINPRFSGTTIFPLKLGIDLPRYYEAALNNSFDTLSTPPAVPDPVLFISYPDEVLLLSKNPDVGFPKSRELRKRFRYIESLFLDDPGLTRNQLAQFLHNAWFTPKTPS